MTKILYKYGNMNDPYKYIIKGIFREYIGCMVSLTDMSPVYRLFKETKRTGDLLFNNICIVSDNASEHYESHTHLTYAQFIETEDLSRYDLIVFADATRFAYHQNKTTQKMLTASFGRAKLLFIYPYEKRYKLKGQHDLIFPDNPSRMLYVARRCGVFHYNIEEANRLFFGNFKPSASEYLIRGRFNKKRAITLYAKLMMATCIDLPEQDRQHFKYSPSLIQNNMSCPGAFVIQSNVRKARGGSSYPHAAYIGRLRHFIAEHFIKDEIDAVGGVVEIDDDINAAEMMNLMVYQFIKYCAKHAKTDKVYGIEETLVSKEIDGFGGTPDFWSYNNYSGILEVMDFKGGKVKVNIEDAVQLKLYALLILEHHPYILKQQLEDSELRIKTTIFQRHNKYSKIYTPDDMHKFKWWLNDYIEKVNKASKGDPTEYLDPSCKNFFCGCQDIKREQAMHAKEDMV